MGCDIHMRGECKVDGVWEEVNVKYLKRYGHEPNSIAYETELLGYRSYNLFGWLADVRNYAAVRSIASSRGFPEDVSSTILEEFKRDWYFDGHSESWVSMDELVSYDYDQLIEDRRTMVKVGPSSWNGAHTCAPGEGKIMTVREFLGEDYFEDLSELCSRGVERLVFWFDN